MRAVQWDGNDDRKLPLLPPTWIGGKDFLELGYDAATRARSAVRDPLVQEGVRRTKRLYAKGALYKGLHKVPYRLLDDTNHDYDIIVYLQNKLNKKGNQAKTCVSVRHCEDREALSAGIRLGKLMKKTYTCRNDTGDEGKMYCVGVRNPGMDDEFEDSIEYKSGNGGRYQHEIRTCIDEYGGRIKQFYNDVFDPIVGSIYEAEKLRKVIRPPYMKNCPAATAVISNQLINSSHVDLDNSYSVTTWVGEEKDESAYFLLPHCSIDGSSGIVIPLRTGTSILWDGRKVHHCTGSSGYKGDFFGIFWSACR